MDKLMKSAALKYNQHMPPILQQKTEIEPNDRPKGGS